jgi:hypothetical protein
LQEAKETGVNAYAVIVEECYGLDKVSIFMYIFMICMKSLAGFDLKTHLLPIGDDTTSTRPRRQRPVFKTWTMILLVKVSKFWTIDF